MLTTAPSLSDQIYDAIVDAICDGELAPGTHLVQEGLAARFGVSRQPIQQAMGRLKADGMVEEQGRRGLFVAALDPERMRHHYGVRAALDGWAAKAATKRVAADDALGKGFAARSRAILDAGLAAVADDDIVQQIRQDDSLHALIYETSGNPMIALAAEPHWRFLRRAMAEVLRKAETPEGIWSQHRQIVDAIAAGDAVAAEAHAIAHVEGAAERLGQALEATLKIKAAE